MPHFFRFREEKGEFALAGGRLLDGQGAIDPSCHDGKAAKAQRNPDKFPKAP